MNKKYLKDELSIFIDQLRNDEKSKRTINVYKRNIVKFIDFIKHDNLITKEDVILFKEYISTKGYKASTLNQIVISINKYFKWLNMSEVVVKKFKTQSRLGLESVITNVDIDRIKRFAKAYGQEDISLIADVLVKTGIRISELVFFTIENLDSYYIQVSNKGKIREIVVPQELRRSLIHFAKRMRIISGPIFDVNDRQIRYRFKNIAGKARVKKSIVHPHNFRHRFALNCSESGMTLVEIKALLGHSDIRTTEIYLLTSKDDKRKKLEKMRVK